MCTTCGCGEGNLYIEGDEHNPHSAFRSAPFAPAARPKMKITGIKTPEFTKTTVWLNATARALLPASNWCSTWFPALVPVKPPC